VAQVIVPCLASMKLTEFNFSEEERKEGKKKGRKTAECYYHFYLHCLILFAQVRCHFIEFTYNTDKVINLKGHCLPSLSLTSDLNSK
jgi:hypothetical protein